MNQELKNLLLQRAGFTACRELAQMQFQSVGNDLKNFDKLDHDLRAFLLLWWLSMTFCGGGIEMYFSDICADYHYEYLDLFNQIGADEALSIFQSAEKILKEPVVFSDRMLRLDKIHKILNNLDEENEWYESCETIDSRFYKMKGDNFEELLINYLEKNIFPYK